MRAIGTAISLGNGGGSRAVRAWRSTGRTGTIASVPVVLRLSFDFAGGSPAIRIGGSITTASGAAGA